MKSAEEIERKITKMLFEGKVPIKIVYPDGTVDVIEDPESVRIKVSKRKGGKSKRKKG
jgi:hypothetical protein